MPTYTIIDSRRVPAVKKERLGQHDWFVTYQTETGFKNLLILQEDPVSDARVKQAVEEDLRKNGKFTGLKGST